MKNNPTSALIVIGNEILSGRTQDKNINYIACGLTEIGIILKEVRVIADIENDIIDTVNELKAKHDYIFTTGGIGPTHDDITSASIAKAFGVEFIQNPEAREILENYYSNSELTKARLSMAMMPEDSTIIKNPISGAPGFKKDNVFVLAGIPNIMQAMFDEVKTTLKAGDKIEAKEITVYIPESKIADILTETQNNNPTIEIGSYPFLRDNKLGVTIVLRSTDLKKLKLIYDDLSNQLKILEEA